MKPEILDSSYLQQILNFSREPIQILSPVYDDKSIVDFRFVITNAAYASYAGATPPELQGRLVSEVFPGYLETSSFTNNVEVFISGIPQTWDIHYNKDGLDLYNTMSANRNGDELVVCFTDFTKMKLLQLELLEKIAELQKSNQQLEEFTYVASHDLKEPIRKIKVFSGLLSESLAEGNEADVTRLIGRIDVAAERMSRLVEDLLHYSHITQKFADTESLDLNEVLLTVLQILDLVISERDATIDYPHLPTIRGNRRQIQQMLQNLLGNAIKFVPADRKPVINISCDSVFEESREYDELVIRDNGIGFDETQSDKIFQIFTRLNAQSDFQGTGVGLSIVKRVVDNHDGFIRVNSEPGAGSAFRIFLPR